MTCAIMQPTYMPWMGYFDLIDKVDTFVFYDDVQLTKRSWQVRNKIKGASGEIWLTIPIKKTKKRDDLLINEAQINYETKWLKKHSKTIEFNYKKTPFFTEIFSFINKNYIQAKSLGEFNTQLIKDIAVKIGITSNFINSSELDNIQGQKDTRLANICKKIEADQYISPQGSSEYINKNNKGGVFVNQNILLFYHNYSHPEYNQLYKPFLPYIGIYDLLFNVGFDNTLEIIRKGRQDNIHYLNL